MVARSMISAVPRLTWLPRSRRTSNGLAVATMRPVAVAELARQVVVEPMAAALGLERQGEGAVAVDVDGLERVHLDRDGERHGLSLDAWPARRRAASSRPKAGRPPGPSELLFGSASPA